MIKWRKKIRYNKHFWVSINQCLWWDIECGETERGNFKGGTECSGLEDWMDNAIMVNTRYMKMYWG